MGCILVLVLAAVIIQKGRHLFSLIALFIEEGGEGPALHDCMTD